MATPLWGFCVAKSERSAGVIAMEQPQPQAQAQAGARRETLRRARERKLQISLSEDERRALTERAREGGFDSVAAYVRARTIPAPGLTAVGGVTKE